MDIPLIYKNGILISCRKYSRLPRNPSKAALRAGGLEKNHPRFAPVFFSAKPCMGAGKRTTRQSRNKNACTTGRYVRTIKNSKS